MDVEKKVDKKRVYRKAFFITINTNRRVLDGDPELPELCNKLQSVFEDILSHDFLRQWVRFTATYHNATYDTHVRRIEDPEGVIEIGGKENRLHLHLFLRFSSWANIAASTGSTVGHYRGLLEQVVAKYFEGKAYVNITNVQDPRDAISKYMSKGLRK